MKVRVKLGDITEEDVDAIVNAAHEHLMGGGGVDGAIHRAAGPGLMQECLMIDGPNSGYGMKIRCPIGEAKITIGCNLPAKHIIHTVGPRCVNGIAKEQDRIDLYNCWYNSLELCRKNGLKSISFSSIATGAHCFPVDVAAKVASLAIVEHFKKETTLEEVNVVCFDTDTQMAYASYFFGERDE
jgi:O-acetyl-ADP-ribose deacetylase (regulator of RNase III)